MKKGFRLVSTLSCMLAVGCSISDAWDDGGLGVASQALSSAELACAFSEKQSPDSYLAKWAEIVGDQALANQFWFDLLPNATGECADDVRDIFWNRAVPKNWNTVPVMSGWPFLGAEAGYFVQHLWLHAVPDGWANGWYRTQFWNDLVPNNLGPQVDPTVVASEMKRKNQAGYYNYWFWTHAVPNGWANGYYRQTFWYHAVPEENWGASLLTVGGEHRSYYLTELYHFAMVYDWAYRPSLGMGYYGYYVRRPLFLNSMSADVRGVYEELLGLAGVAGYHQAPGYGYLSNATGEAPVDDWFAPDAKVVVILTFDNHGSTTEACKIASVLNSGPQPIPATMFLDHSTSGLDCLKDFHIGNHTLNHPKINRQPRCSIDFEISELDERQNINLANLGRDPATFTAFRSPFADGQKTFDAEVADAFVAFGAGQDVSLLSDSSVPYVSESIDTMLSNDNLPIPPGFKAFMTTKPYPFYLRDGLVEFPFVYPSDAVAGSHERDSFWAPPFPQRDTRRTAGYTLDLWKAAFDEIYEARGVMTLLLHPQIMAADDFVCMAGGATPALSALIAYIRSKGPGVYFSDMSEAATRFAQHYAPPN